MVLLLENGANLHAIAEVKGETVTALKLAEKGGHTETAAYIRKCHGKITMLPLVSILALHTDEMRAHGYCLAKLKRGYQM